MNLSNIRLLLPIAFTFVMAAGCSLFSEPSPDQPVAQPTPETDIPFDAREPQNFRANILVLSQDATTRRAYYRKADKWRLDIFEGEELSQSIVHSGSEILIDHGRKLVYRPAKQTGSAEPDFIQELTVRALNRKRYRTFEDLGIVGTIRKFRATIDGQSQGEVILHYDETLKMIVKQEFFAAAAVDGFERSPVYSTELQNVSFEVPDNLFEMPTGYRTASEKEFYQDRTE